MAGFVVPGCKRVVVLSDTHGRLSERLLQVLDGADLLVHAGDITSESDWETLRALAPIHGVLGNNDWYYDYGPELGRLAQFEFKGVTFAVAHYEEDLPIGQADVCICGHTHVARVERRGESLLINPGSASYPRGMRGATVAEIQVKDGIVASVEIVDL
ncbi:metallophosphoesterase [Collinsella sp. zg1085]|uniref:metallophosphoesterase n=1 Tax=Collinsella sp. zg1085 TaxID=2844380 RepID=UPI001C0BE07A|nr:metallophosphoesterase [Collinsella sp. zg1085]QWT17571.1 metallophosphoesterase [Collinsella sp. zg1085]